MLERKELHLTIDTFFSREIGIVDLEIKICMLDMLIGG